MIVIQIERFHRHRESQRTSQSQLAFELGIPRSQLGRIERGKVNTSISSIVAIANSLEIEVRELFNF